jgi:hypothetical protein
VRLLFRRQRHGFLGPGRHTGRPGAEQAEQQDHGDQDQHQFGVALVDQDAERHRGDGGSQRQAGTDETEYLADLPRRGGVLHHDVARRPACPKGEAGQEGHGDDRGDRQVEPVDADHQQRGQDGQAGDEGQHVLLEGVGKPAAEQHAGGRAQHVGGERGGGDGEVDPLGGVQHGDQPGLHAAAGHRTQHEEQEEQDHGAVGEQVAARHPGRAGVDGLADLVAQDAALQDDRDHDRDAEQADGEQGAAPADERHQEGRDRRAGGEAEVAAEGVQREGAAHAVLVHRSGEDGVVGGVDDRVADAGQGGECEDLPELGGEPHGGEGQRHQQGAADEERSRAVAVDQEADRGLQERGGSRHQHDGQAKFGEADVEGALPGEEHRRQAEDVEVRQEVSVADQDIDAGGAAERHGGGLGWIFGNLAWVGRGGQGTGDRGHPTSHRRFRSKDPGAAVLSGAG